VRSLDLSTLFAFLSNVRRGSCAEPFSGFPKHVCQPVPYHILLLPNSSFGIPMRRLAAS